jgi:hypothetical protein
LFLAELNGKDLRDLPIEHRKGEPSLGSI